MARLNNTFVAEELPAGAGSFEPVPAGWYTASITSAELRNTKSGTGEYIAIRYDITGPTHQGRVVFGNLNIRNASPKAEEIGLSQLGEIMKATGIARVSDTDQLVGLNLQVKLSIGTSEQYGDKNEVKGFRASAGGSPAAQSFPKASAPAAQQAAPAAKAAPPWARK